MVTIILVEPENPGNIGAICRAMMNFNYKELILIDPLCNHLDTEAMARAKHARTILQNAKVAPWSVLKEYGVVAATAGIPTSDYNLTRAPLTPREAVKKLRSIKKSSSHKGAALVFGRESSGLKNTELQQMDFVVTIPTDKRYASMNLSHAVAIMLYELSLDDTTPHFTPIPALEKKKLLSQWNDLIDALPFRADHMKETQKKLWKLIFGRASLTRREAFAAFGFVRGAEAGLRQNQSPTRATPKPKRTK